MKKLTLLLAALFIIAFMNLSAQISFEKTFGGTGWDQGYSVQQTTDGGYIIAGLTKALGANDWDIYVVKTDDGGNMLWTKIFGGTEWDFAYSVQQTSDGGYIVSGSTESFGAGNDDVYLIKTDSSGNTLWAKTFGGTGSESGQSVQQTSDGGYIIAGKTASLGSGNEDIYLIKTDSSGDTLWTKTFGETSLDEGFSVQQTSDGGYIIVGNAGEYLLESYVYLIKTDDRGDTLWTKTYGGTSLDGGNSVQQTNDGGYIITGWTRSFGAGDIDVYLIKTDESGDTLWTKTFGGQSSDQGQSVKQASDGGYIIVGWTGSFGAGDSDVYLIKTDGSGDTLWTKTFGGTDLDWGYSVQQTNDGGYIVAGRTRSFGAGDMDVYLIKTDANGDITTGIAAQTNETLSVKIHPNPTSNNLNISVTLQGNDALQYQIFNTIGTTLRSSKTTSNDFSIDVSTLPAGIYFIHLQNSTAKTVQRFVKE